nr:DsbA family protein [uncultured Tolumonas sp.]
MNKTLIYLFDPLCGWCYGATATVSKLNAIPDVNVELLPTGLFADEGAKLMTDEFATYAWSNDQRIAHLTGQKFTERYRELVLKNRQQRFDSGPATIALTAVALTTPTRELETLKAIQHARFVDGQDITQFQTLATILTSLKLNAAAAMVESLDENLLKATRDRIQRAQVLMRDFSARGVPTFIAAVGTKRWLLNTSDVYSNPEALMEQLTAG